MIELDYYKGDNTDPCIISVPKFNESVEFMRKAGYRNVSSRLYPGLRHEIHNETIKADVWKDLADELDTWLQNA